VLQDVTMRQCGCTCGWSAIGTFGKEGKQRVNKRFERTCFLCLEAGVDVGNNKAMDVYSRVMMGTNG